METRKFGNITQKHLIIFQLEQLLKEKYYVFMEGSLLKLRLSIKLELLIAEFKFHRMQHFVE